jgi:hypothetical protein
VTGVAGRVTRPIIGISDSSVDESSTWLTADTRHEGLLSTFIISLRCCFYRRSLDQLQCQSCNVNSLHISVPKMACYYLTYQKTMNVVSISRMSTSPTVLSNDPAEENTIDEQSHNGERQVNIVSKSDTIHSVSTSVPSQSGG